ncbi:membrane protein [Mycolicibacterium parafortuitum]|uniref:Membrane protein n=1 Tax=Mycolicibacterium parafortuitum TaxID=39692 RepID=A0A7I7U392_MYCPF|nr:DUF2752 domain-containing protein [Mycolicibacterium parafortuitum]BBY75767.1 membrane protein [Mycolicibacterium parafortuitum]
MAAAAAGVCVVVWIADPTTPGGFLPVCPTKTLLGVDCPGCGTLRMIYSLLHGDVAAALRFNAVGLVALGLLLVAYALWTYGRAVDRTVVSWQQHRWAAWVTLAVVAVWFVVRILPFEPFTSLRV